MCHGLVGDPCANRRVRRRSGSLAGPASGRTTTTPPEKGICQLRPSKSHWRKLALGRTDRDLPACDHSLTSGAHTAKRGQRKAGQGPWPGRVQSPPSKILWIAGSASVPFRARCWEKHTLLSHRRPAWRPSGSAPSAWALLELLVITVA